MLCTVWAAMQLQKEHIYKIHSVYKNTINIYASDRILAIHPEHIPATPLSVSVPLTDMEFEQIVSEAKKVDYLRIEEENLYICTKRWWIGKVEKWDSKLCYHLDNKAKEQLLFQLQKMIVQYGKATGGMSDAAFYRETSDMDDLITAALKKSAGEMLRAGLEDMDALLDAAYEMIGLGNGLTPSGDDFLTGLILALQVEAPSYELEHSMLCAMVKKQSDRTNDISRQYLLRACEGEYGVKLHLLIREAIKNPLSIPDRLEDVRKTGHSSGLDCLNGLAVGLQLTKAHNENKTERRNM